MAKTVILAKRPDLVIKLEKYGIELPKKEGGEFQGIAKKWAKEKKPPYDKAVYQALAERLPTGWEEISHEEMDELIIKMQKVLRGKIHCLTIQIDFCALVFRRKIIPWNCIGNKLLQEVL